MYVQGIDISKNLGRSDSVQVSKASLSEQVIIKEVHEIEAGNNTYSLGNIVYIFLFRKLDYNNDLLEVTLHNEAIKKALNDSLIDGRGNRFYRYYPLKWLVCLRC